MLTDKSSQVKYLFKTNDLLPTLLFVSLRRDYKVSKAMPEKNLLPHILEIFPNFLIENEAAEFAQKTRDLKPHWIPFGSDPLHPYMYRAGAANYLDDKVEEYNRNRDLFNPLLQKNFASVYQKLILFFESHFQCKIVNSKDLALPGFHIYHGTTMPNGGSVHYDFGQGEWVKKFVNPDVVLEDEYSFTLPIELTEGSGLMLWDLTPEELKSKPPYFWKHYVSADVPGREGFKVEYKVGSLYMIKSYSLHQIAPNNRPVTRSDVSLYRGICFVRWTGLISCIGKQELSLANIGRSSQNLLSAAGDEGAAENQLSRIKLICCAFYQT